MKNYKNKYTKLAEEFIKIDLKSFGGYTTSDKLVVDHILNFAFHLDSLPDQEPKECEHDGTKYDPSKLPWQCHSCGEDFSFKGLTYAKDLPKLPEKLEVHEENIQPGVINPIQNKINQILDYLKNNSN